MADALAENQERINETIDRLERTDTEAATVIRNLLDQLENVRRHGGLLGLNAVGTLSNAARSLRNLENDARTLDGAAKALRGLEDNARELRNAAYLLERLPGIVDSLHSAIGDLRRYSR